MTIFRIFPKVERIQSTGGLRFAQVFEIQRLCWWGWRYVETWESQKNAEDRIKYFTADRTRSRLRVFCATVAGRVRSVFSRAARRETDSPGF